MTAPDLWQTSSTLSVAMLVSDGPSGFTLGQIATVLMLSMNLGGLVWAAAKTSSALGFLEKAVEAAKKTLSEAVEKIRDHTTLHELMSQWRSLADRRLDEHEARLREVEREVVRMGSDTKQGE